MMKLDRGNKDQSSHKKVRSNHELDFRKNRMLWTSLFITMIPAILFVVFWGGRDDLDVWEYALMITGSGLIVLGCLYNLFSFFILNKDTMANNLISSSLLIIGGILYLIGSIGIARDLAHHNRSLFNGDILPSIGRDESGFKSDGVNVRDSIFWFGLFSLIALDAIMLALDIITDAFFAQYLRISMWSWPLLFGCSFVWGVFLCYGRQHLSWWELCGKAGFGTVAVASLFLMILSCIQILVKFVGDFLAFFSFLGSIAVWIYFAAYIKLYVEDASAACFYIGIPWLLSAQSLFLMYDCWLGTKEPKDGAAAHTVHHNNANNPNNINNNNVRADDRI